ncbi:MAG TPA: phage holin family protein [Solirubrobacteraceae bacterium]|nr:phage holin family protein [Solirubrobacteraceae bacterium]
MSSTPGSGRGGAPGDEVPKGIATAIAEISERATLLVREEIELAKAEVAEKTARLVKGAVVGLAAGMFVVTALFFVLIGFAWLLYYYLPIGDTYTYFWGFFAMALILLVLGAIAGLIAARAVKRGAPPTPDMAIEEARRIRDTVSSGAPASTETPVAEPATAEMPVAAFATPAPYGAAAPADTASTENPDLQGAG